ncbi:MAG: ABC transporter ATP-binding protein [Clostridia bacterium]|nr:ABC transporter ATP-binding protein [Clostridia bacterium]
MLFWGRSDISIGSRHTSERLVFVKKQKKTNILRFAPFTKGLRHHFVIALLGTVVSVFANYMTPQVIRVTVDSVINDEPFNLPAFITGWINSLGGREFLQHNIILCALVSVGFALLSHSTMYVSRINMAKGCEGTAKKIRDKLFSHIQRLPYAWHNLNQTGDIIQRCTQDVELIRNFISGQMMELLRVFFLIVTPLILMFSMNAQLALVALAFIPVVLIYSLVFFRIVGKKFQAADEAEGYLTAIVQENLTGVRVVRAFGRERFEKDKFNKQNDLFSDMWVKLGYVMGTNWGLGDLLSGIQVITIMGAGILFVVNGDLTDGEYLAFISYNSMLVWPTRSLGRLLGELSKTTVSSKRLFEILDAVPEQDVGERAEPDMNADIEFKNVNFSYGTSGEVLHDINFKIKAGTTLGILGSTGSGKSTLTYLLDRLYELPEGCGEITIGGRNIQDISLEHLRRNIGIVLQEPFLFSKSFKDTISDGSSRHDLESVRKYARLAVIDDTIDSFAEGYDTQIGERGVTISGGQKQRVAIARMLMQNTPIKIFDDSLSAVDMETDAKIRASINENVHGTTIIIAHRISTIMNADKIIVMDKGRIVQEGTHETLANTDGIYKRIYDTQRSAD